MSSRPHRFFREPLLVGAANFAVGWVGMVFRLSGFRPEPAFQLAIGVGALVLLLPINIISGKHFAGYSGHDSRVNWVLLAAYEAVGLVGLGIGWMILHAP